MNLWYEIRPVEVDDLAALTKLLNQCLVYDRESITEEYVRFRIFEDPNFDPALNLVALHPGGELVSFVSATLVGKKDAAAAGITTALPVTSKQVDVARATEAAAGGRRAWLKVLATSEDYRKRGVASSLLKKILETLRPLGVKEIRFSDRGNWHFWPGLDIRYEDALELLEGFGFRREIVQVDFLYNLDEFFYPRRVLRRKEELATRGIVVRRASFTDQARIISWIRSGYERAWAIETEFAFKKDIPSVVIAEERATGEILGFATFDGVARGRFGPTGVGEANRKRGIGAVLLFEAFRSMKDEGIPRAVVHWTDLLFFYSQVPGLCGIRQYWILVLRDF